MNISLDLIKPSPRPVRTQWNEEKLEELAQSIREQGLIVPIKVRPSDNGHYEIVYGHRRVEAMRRAGITETEPIVEGTNDTGALIQALIENVQREDLQPMDTAIALHDLISATNWSLREIERRGIMIHQQSSWYLTLLDELPEVQEIIKRQAPGPNPDGSSSATIGVRHVIETKHAGLNADERRDVLLKAAKDGLTGDQTRKVAESIAATKDPRRRKLLLESPYISYLHDPEINLKRAERYGEYDPSVIPNESTEGQKWRELPEVKAIIDLIADWTKRVPEVKSTVEAGKFAPEAKPFLALRVRKLIDQLNQLLIVLEVGDD